MIKSLQGEKPDVYPAAPGYLSLYLDDRVRTNYIQLYQQRMKGHSRYAVDHAEDTTFRAQALVQAYRIFNSPPDWIEVNQGASKAWAQRTEIVTMGGVLCYQDRTTGKAVPMHSIPMPYGDDILSETIPASQDIWDASSHFSTREDVDMQMPVVSTDEWLARGDFDLPRQIAADYGDKYFISTILDTPYSDMYNYLGFTGLMVIQQQNPDLFHYMLQRRLLQSKEIVQAWKATGIDGIYVEEVLSGADVISPQNYDQFVFNYNLPYFFYLRSLGLSSIHYVCGDVIPRLERMVEYDIAAIAVEESKKKFQIEIGDVIDRVAGRRAIFGNIDAIRFGIRATAEEMAAEVYRQASLGDRGRGFITSTGSPFPLETDPLMIDTLVSAAHDYRIKTDR